MCLQCLCAPDVFNKRIGSFVLMRATKDPYPNETDPEWATGEFGIVECNDPSFKFKTIPVKVKDSWLNIDDESDTDGWFDAHDVAMSIHDEILQSAGSMKDIVKLVHEAISDASKYAESDVPMAIMKMLYEAIESGFKTDIEVNKDMVEEMAADEAAEMASTVTT